MSRYEASLDVFVDLAEKFIGWENISTVVELGARDCTETAMFAEKFDRATIYAFECNPATLPVCRTSVARFRNVILVEKAASDKNGPIPFFPTNPEKTVTTWKDGNPGASSLLRASGKYPVEKYVQDEIEVESVTLKTFLQQSKINRIDLLWMDIQGAELLALKGLEEHILDIAMIHTEVEFLEIYECQPLFNDLKKFLNAQGFYFIGFTNKNTYFGDAIFVNSSKIVGVKDRIKFSLADKLLVFTGKNFNSKWMNFLTRK